MLPLVFLLVFGAVSLVTWELARPKPNVTLRRIMVESSATTRDRRLAPSFFVRSIRPTLERFGTGIGRVLPQNFIRTIDRMLMMANVSWSLAGFLIVWLAVAAGGLALFTWLIASRPGITPLQTLVLGIGLLPFPAILPYAVLRRRVKKRQVKIIRALPDGLDLMVTCVGAGMGVDSAFGLITERTTGPLSDAFALYLRQVGLGRSRRDALGYVASRSGVPDLVGLAASVAQGEELGTSMSDVLRLQAEELRAARAQRAREKAQRSPVLMTIPLVLFFLPAMGAIVVVPAIINLVDFIDNLGGGV